MKKFFKPSKGKIILTVVLFVVFVFWGASHVQICKFPPCESIPIYSYIIMVLTLWPFAIAMVVPRFWNFLDIVIPIVFYILWGFYYYAISCLWFYKRGTWKTRRYLLLFIGIIIILLSAFNIFTKEKITFGPQFGTNANMDSPIDVDEAKVDL